MLRGNDDMTAKFQSTLPGWGATDFNNADYAFTLNFNPRSPDGERPRIFSIFSKSINFNPRSPDGERHGSNNGWPQRRQDFNPRSPDGERPD